MRVEQVDVVAHKEIADAVDEIIEGRNVSRSEHELEIDGVDVSSLFVERLLCAGFVKTTVRDVEVGFNERVAAFVVRGVKAYFGWVFVERFTEKRERKLFGSVVRDRRGDWKVQVPSYSKEPIFARVSEKLEMEEGRDFVFE